MVVRMKDIAAELDVSVMTVSRVLRNKGRISRATRERVLRRIDELGYQPNVNARNLASGRSFLIGLIVPDLMHPFFAALAKIISRKLRANGYGIAISSTEEDPAVERQEISAFLARGADALVLASSQRSAAPFKRLDDAGVPYVLADRMIRGLDANFIGSDDRAIGILATEHLIARKFRCIAHIGMPGISTGNLRAQGYRAALKRHHLPFSSQRIVAVESSDERGEQCGYEAMQKLLSLRQRPDAVFCYNDVLAYGAFKAIFEAKLRVPEDVGVIGVANMASFSFWDASPVGLTTIDQNVPQLADAISDLVLALVERQHRGPSKRILLQPKLVIRGST